MLQELLQRLPMEGDRCDFGPLQFEVIDAPERGRLVVRVLRRAGDAEDGP
jgi:hypothetical protein